jgi:hypothetical protein
MTVVSFITLHFLKGISVISCTRTYFYSNRKTFGGRKLIKSFSFQVGKERETEKGEREAEEGQGKG